MGNILNLVLPFFGLIALGYIVAKLTRQPLDALGWMNTFIVYVALPAMFFQLLSKTPIERLGEWRYILGSLFATYCIFALMFIIAILRSRGDIASSTIKGLAAAYGNIGYMGPGIVLVVFGQDAAVPVALIFCFENILHFAIAPMMMALAGSDDRPFLQVLTSVIKKIALHPFIIATVVGVCGAAFHVSPPKSINTLLNYLSGAAAPCALFVMGVTLALRPVKKMPVDLFYIVPLKLILHPTLCYITLNMLGNFDPIWVYTAVLLAALPTATNVFVIAQQYGVWVERSSAALLVTTCISVFSVTGLLFLIKGNYLPAHLFVP